MTSAAHKKLSIVVPVLNEEALLDQCLLALQPFRSCGHEIIVVDGGSRDRTLDLARKRADLVLVTARGRSTQMNRGAAVARGDALWFLHVDSRVPPEADQLIGDALERGSGCWGRFDVALSGNTAMLRLVARLMNVRSRLTGIVTGDQGMFVTRQVFEQVGGFPAVALMEDIAISRILKRLGPPLRIPQKLIASSRRWERNGVFRTIGTMWLLRLGYALGVSPSRLARIYDPPVV